MAQVKMAAVLAFCAVVVGFSSSDAVAAPRYNCKSDTRLDSPMDFAIGVQSGVRVRLTAFGGSDKSRSVSPANGNAWQLKNAAGNVIDNYTRGFLLAESLDMLRDVTLEGLVPGATYTITLTSQDLCANRRSVSRSVTMPHLAEAEFNDPVVSDPTTVMLGGFGFGSKVLRFSTTDDTGLRTVEVYFNSQRVASFDYTTGALARWWCAPYPADGVTSTLEGPWLYINYPSTFGGQTVAVEIVVEDVFGNRLVKSVTMTV